MVACCSITVIETTTDNFLDFIRPPQDAPTEHVPILAAAPGEITDEMELVALWKPQSKDDPTERLLNSLATSICYRRCYIETEDGLLPYAPDFAFGGNKTNVFVQFVKVLYAPVVRLHAQCRNDATRPRDQPSSWNFTSRTTPSIPAVE
ncbi:uncharacterized protein RHO25_002247 [Cercospora beticola]|uniref:Uncharacterized protein n=1 Tax=Cercospora beticola TaxID=122368 RepID=A0ABZ0NDN2_CERBT|nr:hypothetical protein RHO25_002247 [Cercospora beticola]CAK1358832.1 unnamed protein product [Cercospora beticola]